MLQRGQAQGRSAEVRAKGWLGGEEGCLVDGGGLVDSAAEGREEVSILSCLELQAGSGKNRVIE